MLFAKFSLSDLSHFEKLIPASSNYLDLLKKKSSEYLSSYQFFSDSKNGFLGISPEGNINIYANSYESRRALLKFGLSINSEPKLVLGDNDLYQNILEEKMNVKIHNPYYYMKLKTRVEIFEKINIREAIEANDQELVNQWYKEFNSEQSSNWEAPILKNLNDEKIYLAFKDNDFIGGVANTLVNSQRLWIGRLFVFKKFRNKGYAHNIMQFIENTASKKSQSVDLLVNFSNKEALKMYTSRNYSKISENAYFVIG